ncbi:DNA polymerase III subunit delta' [Undibacterium sp. Rencai35W]|uniref:DNA polymerase III subunit delta' n=1 Tax=Undibacterium sp. Rencai35W TaxID=3413046 RepID=UPI003BF0456D
MTHPLFHWQTDAWQQLNLLRQRMPHAVLLYGPEGIGKTVFAEHLAQSLLCESPTPDGHACGKCASCGWFGQYSHPDYRRVRPELLDEEDHIASEADAPEPEKKAKASKAPSKEIVINQIRALSDFMNISTHRQGRRVIVLYPAEALNIPAANALLKSLEEPNPNTVFILVSNSLDKLLPTILSRCHKFAMGMPDTAQALAWLKTQQLADAETWLAQQGGAPLSALQMAQSEDRAEFDDFLRQLCKPGVESSLKIAEKMQKLNVPNTVAWLQRWLYDIFSCKQTGRIRYHPRYQKELAALATRVGTPALLQVIKNTNERQAIASHPLSAKLFIEDMLLDYSSLFH